MGFLPVRYFSDLRDYLDSNFAGGGIAFPGRLFFFALLFWLEAGDMLLDFAFEDQHLYELATGSRALQIFEDVE